MKMERDQQDPYIQEMWDIMYLYEACNDFQRKTTCLSNIAFQHLNNGQFLEAIDCYRSLISDLHSLVAATEDETLLETLASACYHHGIVLRQAGYLSASAHYFAEAVRHWLNLGRLHQAATSMFQLALLDAFGTAPPHYRRQLKSFQALLRDWDPENPRIKTVNNLALMIQEKHQLLHFSSLDEILAMPRINLIINDFSLRFQSILEDFLLSKDIKTITFLSLMELKVMQAILEYQDEMDPDSQKLIDQVTTFAGEPLYDFQKVELFILSSKIALLFEKIEQSFTLFRKAILLAKKLDFRKLLRLYNPMLENLRKAVDLIAVTPRKSQRYFVRLVETLNLLSFLRSIELGPLIYYRDEVKQIKTFQAAQFMNALSKQYPNVEKTFK